MSLRTFILIAICGICFFSCEKFDEGGRIKKANEKILSLWRLNGYELNGTDVTASVTARYFTEDFNAGGIYKRTYTESDTIEHIEEGTWEMSADNLSITITGVGSLINFTEADTVLTPSTYKIIRLAKDELWYDFEDGGNTHRFKLVTN